MFNVHTLSTSEAILYTYLEVCGRKGSEVVSSVYIYLIFNYLDPQVKEWLK